jgi:hypothetical protein
MTYPGFSPLKDLRKSQRRAMSQRSAPGAWPYRKNARKPNRMSFSDERIIREMAAASNSLDEIARKLNRSRKAILRKAIEMEIPLPADIWVAKYRRAGSSRSLLDGFACESRKHDNYL